MWVHILCQLDLLVDESWIWDHYISNLRHSLVYLNNKPDSLKWTKNVEGGVYVPQLGYLTIRLEEGIVPSWWCHSTWEIFCSLKIHFFLWLLLEGKVPVWDILVHRFYSGPNRCPLCKLFAESIDHLFIHCQFARDVWCHLSSLVASRLS